VQQFFNLGNSAYYGTGLGRRDALVLCAYRPEKFGRPDGPGRRLDFLEGRDPGCIFEALFGVVFAERVPGHNLLVDERAGQDDHDILVHVFELLYRETERVTDCRVEVVPLHSWEVCERAVDEIVPILFFKLDDVVGPLAGRWYVALAPVALDFEPVYSGKAAQEIVHDPVHGQRVPLDLGVGQLVIHVKSEIEIIRVGNLLGERTDPARHEVQLGGHATPEAHDEITHGPRELFVMPSII